MATPEEIYSKLAEELAFMKTEPRGVLSGIDADTAMELGYETAMHDIRKFFIDDYRLEVGLPIGE